MDLNRVDLALAPAERSAGVFVMEKRCFLHKKFGEGQGFVAFPGEETRVKSNYKDQLNVTYVAFSGYLVGHYLSRDVVGANRYGIGSVHFCWSPRYPHEASTPEEEPTYRIHTVPELLELAETLERTL